jgi:hypothetical protein
MLSFMFQTRILFACFFPSPTSCSHFEVRSQGRKIPACTDHEIVKISVSPRKSRFRHYDLCWPRNLVFNLLDPKEIIDVSVLLFIFQKGLDSICVSDILNVGSLSAMGHCGHKKISG